MLFRPIVRRLSGTFIAATLLCVSVAAAAATPTDVVEGFHSSLIEVLKGADQTKPTGRYQQLEPKVERAFDLPFMIRIASGTKWRDASDAERTALIDAFKRLSVATYAARFDSFSGERFETLGEQDGPNGTRMVLTRITRPGKDSVPITYVMRKLDDEWRAIDVIVSGGISELAVRRSEYNTILSEGGPGGLITRLNQKADQMLTP